jgi:hypothetical protein
MIVNHRYRFIFLKTKKTAGTSTEIALSRYCDGNDIVTKIGHRDEPKRQALGYQGPVNHLEPFDGSLRARFDRWLHGPRHRYWNHMPAAEVREKIGDDVWSSYFKFCFERNPWDRAISQYHWENRSKRALPPFIEYLPEMQRRGLVSNWDTYAIGDRVVVDRVYRYEDLDAALDDVRARLGLPGTLELPDAKRGVRRDTRPYRDVYGDAEREFVARACAREIREFDYEF